MSQVTGYYISTDDDIESSVGQTIMNVYPTAEDAGDAPDGYTLYEVTGELHFTYSDGVMDIELESYSEY